MNSTVRGIVKLFIWTLELYLRTFVYLLINYDNSLIILKMTLIMIFIAKYEMNVRFRSSSFFSYVKSYTNLKI